MMGLGTVITTLQNISVTALNICVFTCAGFRNIHSLGGSWENHAVINELGKIQLVKTSTVNRSGKMTSIINMMICAVVL